MFGVIRRRAAGPTSNRLTGLIATIVHVIVGAARSAPAALCAPLGSCPHHRALKPIAPASRPTLDPERERGHARRHAPPSHLHDRDARPYEPARGGGLAPARRAGADRRPLARAHAPGRVCRRGGRGALTLGALLYRLTFEGWSHSFDTAIYVRLLWGVAHGEWMNPRDLHVFTIHGNFVFFALAPLAWVFGATWTLLGAQALAFGATIGVTARVGSCGDGAARRYAHGGGAPLAGGVRPHRRHTLLTNPFLFDLRPDGSGFRSSRSVSCGRSASETSTARRSRGCSPRSSCARSTS